MYGFHGFQLQVAGFHMAFTWLSWLSRIIGVFDTIVLFLKDSAPGHGKTAMDETAGENKYIEHQVR